MSKKEPQKISGKSTNPQEELLEVLKQKLPEIFAEDKVDCQKLKQTLGEDIDLDSERYGLTWAGKSNCFRAIQEPTTATLKPVREESVDFDNTENLFIEGDNLEVLKILQKSYYGKVKMIYIDPPYNTGNDFIYNDNFRQSKEEYQQEAGIKDENGNLRSDGLMKNSKDRGHYHSNWLNMMYPRLFLARNLLRQDGVIFISIDDNEVHNLRMIMNEIFGEENFVAQVIWHKKYASANDVKGFSEVHDYILIYQKSTDFKRNLLPRTDKQNKLYKYDDKDGRGRYRSDNLSVKTYSSTYDFPIKNPNTGEKFNPPQGRCWVVGKEKIEKWIKEKRIFFGRNGKGAPQLKRYLNEVQEGIVPITYWSYEECGHNDEARKEIKKLFPQSPPFDTPKPTRLIKKILLLSTQKESNDIILDFFTGSATTAHGTMALNAEDGGNRKCISVQIPELCDKKSEAYKAGFKTIADIAKERIRRAGKNFKDKNVDIGFKTFSLEQSNFKIWKSNIKTDKELLEQMNIFVDNLDSEESQESILYELLLKSGLDLSVNIQKKKSDEKTYFSIENGKLIICLEDKISQELVNALLTDKPEKIICLDKAFGDNDQLKTNTLLQMGSAKIDFKVI